MCFFYRRFCPAIYSGLDVRRYASRDKNDASAPDSTAPGRWEHKTDGRAPSLREQGFFARGRHRGVLICFPDENKSIPARRDRYIIPRLRGISFGVSRISRREAIYHFTIRRAAVGCGRPPRAVNVVQKTAALLCKMREKTRRGKSSVEKSRDM